MAVASEDAAMDSIVNLGEESSRESSREPSPPPGKRMIFRGTFQVSNVFWIFTDSSTNFTPLSRPPRRNSLRSSSKIYSVSFQVSYLLLNSKEKTLFFVCFQDCCCILQETTACEAKNRWREAANFDEGPLKSPIIEIPRSSDDFHPDDENGDDEDEEEVLDATDTSRIIAKTKGKRILSKRYGSFQQVFCLLLSSQGSPTIDSQEA